jgi:F-type H+-transporting ATPase subunit b
MPLLLAADLLSYNAGLAFWITIAFGLMFAILAKYAFPAILDGLKERESTIEESMTRAERALAEAKQLQADNEAARREAEAQAQAILRDARDEAERQRATGVEETRAEIAQMQDQAQRDIELQKQQALNELRDEVAGLAVGAAEKILRENLDAGRQRRLVDDFIADLPQN